jgi:hypothetical protein
MTGGHQTREAHQTRAGRRPIPEARRPIPADHHHQTRAHPREAWAPRRRALAASCGHGRPADHRHRHRPSSAAWSGPLGGAPDRRSPADHPAHQAHQARPASSAGHRGRACWAEVRRRQTREVRPAREAHQVRACLAQAHPAREVPPVRACLAEVRPAHQARACLVEVRPAPVEVRQVHACWTAVRRVAGVRRGHHGSRPAAPSQLADPRPADLRRPSSSSERRRSRRLD